MATVTVGGADMNLGRIHMPLRGAWWSDVRLESTNAPSGQVTIAAANGLSLVGAVIRAGVFISQVHAKLVGGAGGLATLMPAQAFRGAVVGDPLKAILSACGEQLSSSVSTSLLTASLPAWAIAAVHGAQALDELAFAAGAVLGQAVNWRVLGDGTIWMGIESWPSQTLSPDSDVLEQFPAGGRYVIGVMTPSLVPGVNLSDLGVNVVGVDHWIDAERVRTWAWSSNAS